MDAIYAECRRLKAEFIKQKERSYPDNYFRTDDGDRYLKMEYWDQLNLEATEYYYKCLDERSMRVPIVHSAVSMDAH
jgi:hypothetical protein